MILLIDNYDSFVYNLARYVGELGYERIVKRNNAITIAQIEAMQPSHIIISPGPCTPDEAGISMPIIKHFTAKIPILGVCLGHQAIGQVFGGKIIRAKKPMHGKSAQINHIDSNLFHGINSSFIAARYHSLVVSSEDFPTDLKISAYSEEKEIMALRHIVHPVFGVQFHPESILTTDGYQILKNFINMRIK